MIPSNFYKQCIDAYDDLSGADRLVYYDIMYTQHGSDVKKTAVRLLDPNIPQSRDDFSRILKQLCDDAHVNYIKVDFYKDRKNYLGSLGTIESNSTISIPPPQTNTIQPPPPLPAPSLLKHTPAIDIEEKVKTLLLQKDHEDMKHKFDVLSSEYKELMNENELLEKENEELRKAHADLENKSNDAKSAMFGKIFEAVAPKVLEGLSGIGGGHAEGLGSTSYSPALQEVINILKTLDEQSVLLILEDIKQVLNPMPAEELNPIPPELQKNKI